MNAEVITVGTELLLGHVVDTNSAYIGKRLAEVGINLFFKSAVGDNLDRIVQQLRLSMSRASIVIVTGGLGPTGDDITKEALAIATGREMVLVPRLAVEIEKRFASMGRQMTPNNLRQAEIPKGAEPLPNPAGTAPGVMLEHGGVTVFLLPGVPREMRTMFEDSVMPYLKQRLAGEGGGAVIKSRTLKVAGLGESACEAEIADILREQTNPTIAPLAYPGEVLLRITARALDERAALDLIAPVEEKIRERLGPAVFGVDDETLESACARLAIKNRVRIAVAESCTGGLISHRLTNVPGVSETYVLGVVSYSNDAKERVLGVPGAVLSRYGAVSRECAIAMARGVMALGPADIGIATTGIAGPSGATPTKPVGLVYIALASGSSVVSSRFNFPGNREEIKLRAANAALNMLRLWLLRIAFGREGTGQEIKGRQAGDREAV
ncbi:MAG TPA: competence/damage-inducible protein A [Firmicutes bacterium]|nr:competence/damage-inducible protein A [Bacillota bacterium]